MPDHVPPGLTDIIKNKSKVLSVPINPSRKTASETIKCSILWNHRWEYDKAPERFLFALRKLRELTEDFRLNLAGQFFRDVPDSFKNIKNEFKNHIDHCGYAETREDYGNVMARSSVVVSTSLHDFQGLSVIEAADAGCTPVLPDRVAYPELFPPDILYAVSGDVETEAENCAKRLLRAFETPHKCDMSQYYWENMKIKYMQLFYGI
jgi:glycosyltransferase involved in cell wall biosynthesis